MQSFADDINNYLGKKPVNATSQSFYYRLSKFAHRNKALFVSLTALFFSLLLGLAISLWQFQKIKIESAKAQHVKQFMLDSFQVTNPDVSQGNTISANDILTIATNKLYENNKLDNEIKFELYQSLAIAYDQLGLPKKAIELFNKSRELDQNNSRSIAYLAANYLKAQDQQSLDNLLTITDETAFKSIKDYIKFSLVRAENLSLNGHKKQAITLIDKIQNHASIESLTNEWINIQRTLAGIYYESSDYSKTVEILNTILTQSQLPLTHTLILRSRLDLGRAYNTMGKHSLALAEFNQIEKAYKQILGDSHPDLGGLYYRMASSFKATGQMEKAHHYAQLSYDTNTKLFGKKGTQVPNSLNMLAVLAQADGKLDDALNFTEQAIEILQRSYSPDLPQLLEFKTNYAHLLGLKKQHKKALKILQQVYQAQKEKLGLTHFSTLNTESSLVSTLLSLKQIDEAKTRILTHIQRVEEHFNPQSILTLNAYTLLARVYTYSKEKQKRLETFLTIEKKKIVDESSPYYVMILFNIAQAYNQIDNTIKAEAYFQKAFLHNAKIYDDKHISTLQMKIQYAKYLYSHEKYSEVQAIVDTVKQVVKQENHHNQLLNSWIEKLEKKMVSK
jgi:tetratricopeptide (TPR) repeat protein